MKKRILTICIAILTVSMCVFFAACSSGGDYGIKETSLKEGGESAAALVKEICAEHPDRTMGTGNDYAFLGYVAEKMTSYGYPDAGIEEESQPSLPGTEGGSQGETTLAGTSADGVAGTASVKVQEFAFKNYYTSKNEKGYNLVYEIPAAQPAQGHVLLLAAYDNCASLTVSDTDLSTGQITSVNVGGEGAYSTASGVAVLLRIAYELAGKNLPYDLTIAFVDCSENEWDGSRELIGEYSFGKDEKFVCLNFGKLGAGDYTYLYSDEVSQPYNDYFYSVVDKTDDGVFASVPLNKQTADVKFIEAQKVPYSHFAMYGDNLMFNIYGLAVVNYVSFNWSSFEHPFYTETSGYENLYGTSADTYAEVIERLGGEEKGEELLAKRLDAVVLNAVTAVGEENAATLFDALAQSDPAKGGDFAKNAETASMIVKIVLIAAAVAAVIWLIVKGKSVLAEKQKKKIDEMRREAAGGQQGKVPEAKDIFEGFDEKDGDKNDKNGGSGGNAGGSDGGDVFEGF